MAETRTVFWFLLLTELVTDVKSTYQTFYADSACKRSGHLIVTVGSSGQNSSGILKSSISGAFSPGMNCPIVVSPPRQYGVVASVRFLDLKPEETCDNHLKIFTDPVQSVTLCGYNSDITKEHSYTSDGEMTIWFHTTNESASISGKEASQFELTVTSFRKGGGYCRNDEKKCDNDYCVWKGLFCDGRNNCGDRSDENEHCITNHKNPSRTLIWTVVALTIASLVFIVFLIYRMQSRITRRIENLCSSYTLMPSQVNGNLRVPLNDGLTRTPPNVNLPSTSSRYEDSRPMDIQRGKDLLTQNHCIKPNKGTTFLDSPPCNHPPFFA